jgi:Na+/H+ antiporter NhaD/arsenite permease-like protein
MNLGILIFIAFYFLVSTRYIETLKLDRTAIAIIFVSIAYSLQLISAQSALLAVDMHILLLLFAMMGMGAFLLHTGLLGILLQKLVDFTATTKRLLMALVLIVGLFSALITNDAVCLILTPILIELIKRYQLPPLPFLLALCTSANTGSAATLVGNPQNMLCAKLGQLQYFDYLSVALPIAILSLFCNYAFIAWIFDQSLRDCDLQKQKDLVGSSNQEKLNLNHHLILVIFALTIVIYSLGVDLAWTSLLGFALMLILIRVRSEAIWGKIDFSLLVFFSGLFILLTLFIASGGGDLVFNALPQISGSLRLGDLIQNSAVFMFASNIVSNVPFILMVEHELKEIENAKQIWTLLALTSTFAGNSTLFGSVANLIVAESSKEIGGIGFMDILKVGLPISLISSTIAIIYILVLSF